MGHYDSSRPGYCASCGAAPGNMINGKCQFCNPEQLVTFYGGQTVKYKNNSYIVILTPDIFKMKIYDKWVPGYLYNSMDGKSYSRTKEDFESKFS